MNDFSSLGLDTAIIGALTTLGFTAPTEVQRQSIPLLLQKRNLSMQSETGTGKTMAYLLPIFSTFLILRGLLALD